MKYASLPSGSDVRHLGLLIGPLHAKRIIAVSTSMVFEDPSLIQAFWGLKPATIDSGFQGHMYTRKNDVLIVQVPGIDPAVPDMVIKSIAVNSEIWKSLTGIELSTPDDDIVLAAPRAPKLRVSLPSNICFYRGSLPNASISRFLDNDEALLVFVLNNYLVSKIEQQHTKLISLEKQAHVTSRLMDKNYALHLMEANKIPCAKTYFFNEDTDMRKALASIPGSHKYIFKPAGGAAGIGVYGNDGLSGICDVSRHIEDLNQSNKLPRRFQLQEFLPGIPYGCTAWLNEDGSFEMFEIHRQLINTTGRFTGGRWTPAIMDEQQDNITDLYKQLVAVRKPRLTGLMCLDVIDGRIIELNPRLTASAPIAHILQNQHKIHHLHGRKFHIRQIDLNTSVNLRYEYVADGALKQIIGDIRRKNHVLILPQGLNPFGNSRFIFINDDKKGSAQKRFLQMISSDQEPIRLARQPSKCLKS